MVVSTKAPNVSFHPDYFASWSRLDPVDMKRLNEALLKFQADPGHPGLNLEQLDGSLSDLMSIRAGRDIRVILYREGDTYIWWFADHHDAAYERAARARLVINPQTRFVGFVERPDKAAIDRPAATSAEVEDRPRPFDHWSDVELGLADLSATEIASIRRLRSEDEILDLERAGWADERVTLAIDILGYTPEQWSARGTEEEPAASKEERLRAAISGFGALSGLSPLFSEEELQRIASAPIEEWMLFLHPDQRVLVDREFSGPARVRGAAGTGKTVVVLHRAAALALRYPSEQVLVTTYINSLPPVFESLHRRLPNARAGQVEFLNVDKLAYRICTEGGARPSIDPKAVDSAFRAAWRSTVGAGSAIERAGLTQSYVMDEIRFVIKGRGLASFDQYADLRRTGRRTQFGGPLRSQVWALKQAWDDGMSRAGVEDFHDVVLRARDFARARTSPTYRAALIDESQDLTLVALQLIRSLVNGPDGDRPDALFIAGDGAQRIYAGGFTLRQAGVEVRGRTSVLKVNYRNTESIYEAAVGVAGAAEVEDLDEEYLRSEEPAEVGRSGAPVELLVGASFDGEIDLIVARAKELLASEPGLGLGDLVICCATNQQAKAATARIRVHGLETQELGKYDGTANGLVKVGTHHRVKGLEFKVVFLPGLSDGGYPRSPTPGMDPKEYAEQLNLSMSALFVAMTRARDRLVLSCTEHPSAVLEPIIGRLHCQTP